MSEERQIELTWRCTSCQYKNLGRHMVCQDCGNPKDESETYEMPEDTAAAATVVDPKLVRMAKAGEHWHCRFCGSHQRDLDGGCAQCGAGRKEGATVRGAPTGGPRFVAAPALRGELWRDRRFWVAAFALAFIVGSACWVKSRMHPRVPDAVAPVVVAPLRTELPATVEAVHWSTKIVVERWALVTHEGFRSDVPADALDIADAGTHFHHNEAVFDHDETVYDDVEVPDGTRTETYSEHVACGQDCTQSTRSCRQVCTPIAKVCHEVCTNKKNGFASCHQECSGGGQSCSDQCTGSESRCTTKYCDQQKTREVAKTRHEKRPRIEKKYRQEPRVAPWSTYDTWEWVAGRIETDEGDTNEIVWADAGLPGANASNDASQDATDAGAERAMKSFVLAVTFAYEDGRTRVYHPTSLEQFEALKPGTKVMTRVQSDFVVELLDGG